MGYFYSLVPFLSDMTLAAVFCTEKGEIWAVHIGLYCRCWQSFIPSLLVSHIFVGLEEGCPDSDKEVQAANIISSLRKTVF